MNLSRTVVLFLGCVWASGGWRAQAQEALPKPQPPFSGVMDQDVKKSTPAWPEFPSAPKGAPNVVLILVDDVGFSTTSTFGGPVDTPNFDKLARSGLRYNQFFVNSICSPTRGALLSGRNSHQVGFGITGEHSAGYPGYNTVWPKSAASIAEVLKDHGYSTAAFGKWHNTPLWEISPVGPFDRWPTGLGFEYFYGFMSGADNQYYPRIYRNTEPVEPPTTPEQGYTFTTDMANEAIRWLRQHDAVDGEKPFFIYFATGATHAPIQVPKEWSAKYKGKFDEGWDKLREGIFQKEKALGVIPANAGLTPRPEGLAAWDSLTPEQKQYLAHEQEVYAGYTAQADYEIGRVLQAVHEAGKADNTIVIEIFGDNGASAQGGRLGYDALQVTGASKPLQERLATEDELGSEMFMDHFAAPWAWSLSAPFKGTKVDSSHLGGVVDPLVISWPARIKDVGGLRTQFTHVTDIAPTLYEAIGLSMPKEVNGVAQMPLEGTSMVYTFDHPNEPSRHHVQYFESGGNLGIYKDGWWAGNLHRSSWDTDRPAEINAHPWELYNLKQDFSQAHDLAAQDPEKLKEMEALFDSEAKRNDVYPLLPVFTGYPQASTTGQTVFTYREGDERIPIPVAAGIVKPATNLDMGHQAFTRSGYTITADVEIPARGANGVIFAEGGRYSGVALFVKNNHVIFEVNAYGNRSGQLISSDSLVAGKAHIVVEVTVDPPSVPRVRPGSGTLSINGKPEGTQHFLNLDLGTGETLDIGSDLGSPVSPDYQTPNRFTGKIESVVIQLK